MVKKIVPALLLLASLTACRPLEIETGKPCKEVEAAIRQYYAAKYPSFAAVTALGRTAARTVEELRKASDLHGRCPVSEIVNSFPHGPYITFVERTESAEGKMSVVTVDLYANEDRTCRAVVRVDQRKKQDGLPCATGRPITEAEIRKLLE